MQKTPPQQEPIPHALVFHLNEYGQLRVKTRLVLTAPEVAELLRIGTQKARWLMYRREIASFHIGSRRVVSLDALEHYIRNPLQERLLAVPAIGTFYLRLAPGEDILRVDALSSTFGRNDLHLLEFSQQQIPYTAALPIVQILQGDYGAFRSIMRHCMS